MNEVVQDRARLYSALLGSMSASSSLTPTSSSAGNIFQFGSHHSPSSSIPQAPSSGPLPSPLPSSSQQQASPNNPHYLSPNHAAYLSAYHHAAQLAAMSSTSSSSTPSSPFLVPTSPSNAGRPGMFSHPNLSSNHSMEQYVLAAQHQALMMSHHQRMLSNGMTSSNASTPSPKNASPAVSPHVHSNNRPMESEERQSVKRKSSDDLSSPESAATALNGHKSSSSKHRSLRPPNLSIPSASFPEPPALLSAPASMKDAPIKAHHWMMMSSMGSNQSPPNHIMHPPPEGPLMPHSGYSFPHHPLHHQPPLSAPPSDDRTGRFSYPASSAFAPVASSSSGHNLAMSASLLGRHHPSSSEVLSSIQQQQQFNPTAAVLLSQHQLLAQQQQLSFLQRQGNSSEETTEERFPGNSSTVNGNSNGDRSQDEGRSCSPPPPPPPASNASTDSDPNLSGPLCYKRGTMIELADGNLRRVEDMQTQDFLTCVESTPDLAVDVSQVVRIDDRGNGNAYITLAVGRKKTNFLVETPLEHPFFVYHKGWSSCSPPLTLSRYGLQARKLQVGDSCVSLTKSKQNNGNRSHKHRLRGEQHQDIDVVGGVEKCDEEVAVSLLKKKTGKKTGGGRRRSSAGGGSTGASSTSTTLGTSRSSSRDEMEVDENQNSIHMTSGNEYSQHHPHQYLNHNKISHLSSHQQQQQHSIN